MPQHVSKEKDHDSPKKILVVIALSALIAVFAWVVVKQSGKQELHCKDGQLTTEKVIQSHRGYCIRSSAASTQYKPGEPAPYSFSIIDDQDATLSDFDTVHEKNMHVIVVRKDLANFQHVHPDYDANTGRFTLINLTFPTDGEYRIFADFTPTTSQMGPDGQKLPVTLSEDVAVGDTKNYQPQPIGGTERMKMFGDYEVTLSLQPEPVISQTETKLSFMIMRQGQMVTNLENYLGALGHSVVLREGILDFIHTHPQEAPTQTGTVEFMATFPSEGNYKVFSQFQHEGKIFTTDYVVVVGQGAETGTPPPMEMPMSMPGGQQ